MFYLKKIITAFIIPPGFFISLLCACIACFIVRKRRFEAALCFSIALLMWACSITPVADIFLIPLEHRYEIPENVQGDVIVVFGAGAYRGVPSATGPGACNADSMIRLVSAATLHRLTRLPLIVSGGRAFPGDEAESLLMKRALIGLGVNPSIIITEEASRDTEGNAAACARICAQRGFTRPVLVTSAYHMRRAVLLCGKHNLQVTPYPTGFRSAGNRSYGLRDYLPSNRMEWISYAIKEYLALAFYSLQSAF
jgi:uncharacterized SAM-binding protein YcdF (DUF218 family)